MKSFFYAAGALLLTISITGCTLSSLLSTVDGTDDTGVSGEPVKLSTADTVVLSTNKMDSGLYDAVLASYYAGQNSSVWTYFQNNSITRFLAGWVKEATGDIDNPQWNYDSFTSIEILDHDFVRSRPDEQLYCCTFSDGVDRYGYIIVRYDDEGPGLSQWGVTETTPHLYDFKANIKEIMAGLAETDIDLATATASRVYLYDRENTRADQVIRFTDGKGDNYLYYFGDTAFKIEKFEYN